MSGARASWQRVKAVAEQLSERDKQVIQSLATVRTLTGAQLERLVFFQHELGARSHIRRRVLNRLVRLGIVATLERRIGGIRAGSQGLIYCLDRLGQRMVDYFDGMTSDNRARTPRTPGHAFLSHTLAISEIFVSLTEASRHFSATVRDFLTEPTCWWPDGDGGALRPDALIVLENERFEATTWLEVDQGTEQLSRIGSKLALYGRFGRSGLDGPGGVLPQVLFAAPDPTRTAAIAREIDRQGQLSVICGAVQQSQVAAHLFTQLSMP